MKFTKDYKKWHSLKNDIHNSENQRPFFHEREIWFCHLGENVGFEQDGSGEKFLRPIIVFKKNNKKAQEPFVLSFFVILPPISGVGPKPFVS